MNVSKEITIVLKAFLPLVIVLHHLAFKTDILQFSWLMRIGPSIVSLFFFMSGYGLFYSLRYKPNYLNDFATKRLSSLLIPYIISIIIYQGLSFFIDKKLPINDLFIFLDGDTNCILPASWYVIVIFILYCLFWVCFITKNIISKQIILFFISGLILIFLFKIINFPAYWYISIGAFFIGTLYSMSEWLHKKHVSIIYTMIYFTVIIICYMINSLITRMVLYALIPLLIIKILNITKVNSLYKSNIIFFLSKISYEIYLSHVIIYRLLRNDGLYIKSDYMFIILCFIFTIILSYIIMLLTNKIKAIWS